MKLTEMNLLLADELGHIPRFKGNLQQNMFRSMYNGVRRHDLSIEPTTPRHESFRAALETARTSRPEFTPAYDREFFGPDRGP